MIVSNIISDNWWAQPTLRKALFTTSDYRIRYLWQIRSQR